MLIQELIPGDGRQQFSYCAFFKNGEAIASMVAQRRRHPQLAVGLPEEFRTGPTRRAQRRAFIDYND